MAADIKSLINRNRTIARQYADKASATTLKDSLVKAQKELVDRIDASVRLGREESFTAVQAQTALKQMQDVLKGVTAALKTSVVDTGKIVSAAGVTSTVAYVRASEKKYHGVAAASALRLDEAMMLDKVVSGTSSSQLSRLMSSGEEDAEVGVLHPGKAGILERYHHNVVGKFEDQLRGHYLARRPWEETREALIKESPLLTGKEPGVATTWAERILRTETSFAQNKSNVAAMQVANESLGDGCKILVATFDDRTAADSYAVHGQIRRLTEPFDTWSGSFMHPPARPNDREVVVPHRISWPIPAELTPKSDGEVSARWTYEGRKGSPPGRPKMTTIELSEFGKESTKREQLGIESEKQPEFKYPTVEEWKKSIAELPEESVYTLKDSVPDGMDPYNYRHKVGMNFRNHATKPEVDSIHAFTHKHDHIMRLLDGGATKADAIASVLEHDPYMYPESAKRFVDKCARHVKRLNEALDKPELQFHDTVVYRGLKLLTDEVALKLSTKGATFSMESMSSTSRSSAIAEQFSSGSDETHGIILRMKVKTAVGIEAISHYPHETELLLKKTQRFLIISAVRAKDRLNKIIVTCEEI